MTEDGSTTLEEALDALSFLNRAQDVLGDELSFLIQFEPRHAIIPRGLEGLPQRTGALTRDAVEVVNAALSHDPRLGIRGEDKWLELFARPR